METSIICTIITGFVSLMVAYFTYIRIHKENELNDAVRDQKIMDKLAQLEDRQNTLIRKVDIHNGYAEKFGEIAIAQTGLRKDIEYIKEKIK